MDFIVRIWYDKKYTPIRKKVASNKNKVIGSAAIIVIGMFAFSSCINGPSKNDVNQYTAPPVATASMSPTPVVTSSPVSEPVTSNDIQSKLNLLVVAEAAGVNYERGEWHHWNDLRSCWSVREQVLADEAVNDGTLTLLDRNKVRTNDINSACYVSGGTWIDAYTGETFTNPEDLDIDHMIPLNYAAQHGGQAWDSAKKESYANNREYANHLIAVSASANRSKSDKGPSQWKPSNKSYYCTYATDWVNISTTWNLSVTLNDKNALQDMLSSCP